MFTSTEGERERGIVCVSECVRVYVSDRQTGSDRERDRQTDNRGRQRVIVCGHRLCVRVLVCV